MIEYSDTGTLHGTDVAVGIELRVKGVGACTLYRFARNPDTGAEWVEVKPKGHLASLYWIRSVHADAVTKVITPKQPRRRKKEVA